MKYTVYPEVFELDPLIEFGIIIGKNMNVSETTEKDAEVLRTSEERFRASENAEDIRSIENVARYREIMRKAGINPNKFMASVEAMFKRVAKGNSLPNINSLVDLCNAVSLDNCLSLGGHDLKDIYHDLEVRFSDNEDRFLPFGETEWEQVGEGELIFTAGHEVQTRKWVWRQSEYGKIDTDTRNVFFQIAGFKDDDSLKKAVESIEALVRERFNGECSVFFVNKENPSIEF